MTLTSSSDDSFFAELEAEIAVATKQTKLKADREAAKKRANNMHVAKSVRDRASADYKALDSQLQVLEWQSVSTVAMFTEQTCDGCGSTHQVFLQYMECQQLIRKPSTQRWQRVTRPDPDLPRESLVQPMLTHICSSCCEEHGFALLTAKRLKPRQETITPSFTYDQEDINAPST